MASVAKVKSDPAVTTSCSQKLTDTQAVIRNPRILLSKELIQGIKTVDSNQDTPTPVIPKTQAPKISRIPVVVSSRSQDNPDILAPQITKDQINESKTVVAINVAVLITSRVIFTPSVPTPSHIPSDPPMLHAVLPSDLSSACPKPLSPASPPSRYTTPAIAAA